MPKSLALGFVLRSSMNLLGFSEGFEACVAEKKNSSTKLYDVGNLFHGDDTLFITFAHCSGSNRCFFSTYGTSMAWFPGSFLFFQGAEQP